VLQEEIDSQETDWVEDFRSRRDALEEELTDKNQVKRVTVRVLLILLLFISLYNTVVMVMLFYSFQKVKASYKLMAQEIVQIGLRQ
jgi:hypothetical protein